MPPSRPNVLLLMTDQHRGDCLGCAGNPAIHTPNLDRIAREGIRFSQAYSSTPSCTPARAGLLTGQSPWNHGMLGYGRIAGLYPAEMPVLMRGAGYYTFAIGKLHYFPQRNYHGYDGALLDESGRVETKGFVSDYRQWFAQQAPGLDPDATGIRWNDYRSAPYALPEELHPTRWMGDRAVEFIREYDRDEPFFLKVSFARPHSPYDPPQRFLEMYSESEMPAAYTGKWAARHAAADPSDYNSWHGDLGPEQVARSRRGYYGSVSFIDEQVGRILAELHRRGLLENTLVLMTADHGDMTGDHHLWRKTYAYDGSARIPMLLRWPRSFAPDAKRGVVSSRPVELRDVLPTLLDAAGARVPDAVDGKSLLQIARGEDRHWRDCIDLEHSTCYDKTNSWTALTDGRWKYIFSAYDGSEQLFDLRNDPGEERDLSAQPSASGLLGEWRQRMVEHLAARGERYVRNGELVTREQGILYSPNYPDYASVGRA